MATRCTSSVRNQASGTSCPPPAFGSGTCRSSWRSMAAEHTNFWKRFWSPRQILSSFEWIRKITKMPRNWYSASMTRSLRNKSLLVHLLRPGDHEVVNRTKLKKLPGHIQWCRPTRFSESCPCEIQGRVPVAVWEARWSQAAQEGESKRPRRTSRRVSVQGLKHSQRSLLSFNILSQFALSVPFLPRDTNAVGCRAHLYVILIDFFQFPLSPAVQTDVAEKLLESMSCMYSWRFHIELQGRDDGRHSQQDWLGGGVVTWRDLKIEVYEGRGEGRGAGLGDLVGPFLPLLFVYSGLLWASRG